jgi:hypothetical protein
MKIGLDIDGVLCNFAQGAIDKARQLGLSQAYKFHASWTEVDQWYLTTCGSPDPFSELWPYIKEDNFFWWNLQPLPYSGPVDFTVDRYVTSRPVSSDLSRQWLIRHGFPDATVITVSKPEHKLDHVQDLDLFVDDHWETVRHLRLQNVNAVLYWAPYQSGHDVSDLPRIKHLSEVNNYVRN